MSNQPYATTTSTGGGIMQTAKFGMYGLIATAVDILLTIAGLFPLAGLFGLAGLVLAIISLVKKERPVWPAWVTLGLAIATIVLIFIAIAGLVALGGALLS